MQALIDFDGWRKWKDFSAKQSNAGASNTGEEKTEKKSALSKKKKSNRMSVGSASGSSVARPGTVREDEKESVVGN